MRALPELRKAVFLEAFEQWSGGMDVPLASERI
jgi:hypothetical protein